MNLLVFAPYYPPHIGGLENYANELNKYLSREGIDITVFTPHLPKNSSETEVRSEKVKIIRFPAFEIISGYPLPKFWSRHFWKLFRNLFRENFDVVLSHTRFFSTSLLAYYFSAVKKARWIHIEHGSDFVQLESKLVFLFSRAYDITFGKLVLKKAFCVVAISESVRQFVNQLSPSAKCQVIYRGFDQEEIETITPDHKLKEKYKNSLLIIFIGRLISGKGVRDLIAAIGLMKNKNVKCLLVGDGPEKNNLENLSAELGLEEKTIFLGYKKHAEAIALLKAADIFVNPSYTEGLPTTIIEAAFCRKAIIATNVGGTAEIVTDSQSGILIEPKNPRVLAEKLDELSNDAQLRETLGKKAFASVKNKFDWEKSIAKFIRLFNENQLNGK